MPYAITDTGWRAVGPDFTEADLAPGETLVDEIPQWLIDKIAEAEVLQQATNQLNALTRQANAQVSALTGRVATLEYLINDQDPDDPDYIAPTADEVAELPIRKAQLKSWNSYNVKLGRVKTAAGWPATPAWPVMPEPYTTETSAVSSPTE